MRIDLVRRDGTVAKTLALAVSDTKPPQFDEDTWDKVRAIREFRAFLEARNGFGLEAAMRALDRLDCWRDALHYLIEDNTRLKENLGGAVMLLDFQWLP